MHNAPDVSNEKTSHVYDVTKRTPDYSTETVLSHPALNRPKFRRQTDTHKNHENIWNALTAIVNSHAHPERTRTRRRLNGHKIIFFFCSRNTQTRTHTRLAHLGGFFFSVVGRGGDCCRNNANSLERQTSDEIVPLYARIPHNRCDERISRAAKISRKR